MARWAGEGNPNGGGETMTMGDEARYPRGSSVVDDTVARLDLVRRVNINDIPGVRHWQRRRMWENAHTTQTMRV